MHPERWMCCSSCGSDREMCDRLLQPSARLVSPLRHRLRTSLGGFAGHVLLNVQRPSTSNMSDFPSPSVRLPSSPHMTLGCKIVFARRADRTSESGVLLSRIKSQAPPTRSRRTNVELAGASALCGGGEGAFGCIKISLLLAVPVTSVIPVACRQRGVYIVDAVRQQAEIKATNTLRPY